MNDIQHAAFSKRLFAFLADVVIAGLLVAARKQGKDQRRAEHKREDAFCFVHIVLLF